MSGITVVAHKVDRVIVTSMPRGRVVDMHAHRRKRVAKKYQRAMVFLRSSFAPDRREYLHEVIRDVAPYMTRKALRRMCRVLCKAGIESRVLRDR